MTRRPVQKLVILAALVLLLPACKGEEPVEDKPEEKKAPPPPPPDDTPPAPQFDLSGPKPPATSSVVFAVDGALLPLACFNKDKSQLLAGKECGGLVAEGAEVYMESSFGNKALDKTGAGTKASLCGDSGAIPTPQLDGGAAYDWGVWPKSLGPDFKQIDPDTWTPRGSQLEEAEAKAVQDAIAKIRNVQGEFQPKQKATADIDGDGKDELFVSAILANPADPDTYLFSGLFMAAGGDLANLVLIDRSKKGADVIRLRGVVDLDGDGKRELWTSVTFEGGNGDRIVQMASGEPKPLGDWTCGAG
jgi:hypothetical protein